MKHVPLAKLEDKIVRPGFDKHLKPLIMYRGNMTLGRAHRLWNTLVTAMEHEATCSDITQRLVHNPDHSQLCGSETKLTMMGLSSFCGRLSDNPKVMAEMSGLKDYIDWMLPEYRRGFALERVSEMTHRRRHMGAGGWRTFKPLRTDKTLAGRKIEKVIEYPFLIHDGGKPEHDLLRKVIAAVGRALPPDQRADACQDLIVGILSGEFNADDLGLPAKAMRSRIMRFCQNKYAEVSLYESVPNTDGDLKWIDVFSQEDSLWERI